MSQNANSVSQVLILDSQRLALSPRRQALAKTIPCQIEEAIRERAYHLWIADGQLEGKPDI